MNKLFKTALCFAAACTIGFTFTACDKDEDTGYKLNGTISVDGKSQTFKSGFFMNETMENQSMFMIALLPEVTTITPTEETDGMVTFGAGNIKSGTIVDLAKFDDLAGFAISYIVNEDLEYNFTQDNDRGAYYLMTRIDGNHTTADDLKLTEGTAKYTLDGEQITITVDAKFEKGKTLTLTAKGKARKAQFQD